MRALAAAAVVAAAVSGCLFRADTTMAPPAPTPPPALVFSDERDRIQVISALVGGKNVFIPGTLVLTAGSGRMLSFFNATDQPHGMTIPGLGLSVVLTAGEETVVELPELRGGQIYAVVCHLHGPHRTGTLVVLPAAQEPPDASR